MAIDASIALQAKLPQFDNPLTQYAQVAAIQNAQNQNRLADLTYAQHEREVGSDNALAKLLAGGKAGDDVVTGLAAQGYGKNALAYGKTMQEQAKAKAELGKTTAETGKINQDAATHQFEIAGQLAGAWANDPTITADKIRSGLAAAAHSKIISPEIYQAKIAELDATGQDPASLKQWALTTQQQVIKAADQMKYTTVDANTAANNRTSLATTGMNNATSIKTTGMNNQTSRANNADNITSSQAINGMGADGLPSGDVEAMAKAIASGQLQPINGFALAKPRGQAIMARVMELNPTYDAGDYAAKNNALKGFSTGKEGTALRSFNVAVDHLDTLGTMADALNNKDTRVLNTIGNAWAKQTGAAAPTNFEAVKEIVAKEVVKAIVAGGGGVSEREEISKLMDKANSPAQLKGVITHFRELMDAQRSGLMDQYKRTTGRDDGETVFAPSQKPAKQVAEAVNNGESARLAAAKPVSVKSAADYAKLPPGTVYTAPDGSQRTKQ